MIAIFIVVLLGIILYFRDKNIDKKEKINRLEIEINDHKLVSENEKIRGMSQILNEVQILLNCTEPRLITNLYKNDNLVKYGFIMSSNKMYQICFDMKIINEDKIIVSIDPHTYENPSCVFKIYNDINQNKKRYAKDIWEYLVSELQAESNGKFRINRTLY
ncbi:MAG: hypothetical protein ACOH1X_00925 [Kaistella sp.]